MAICHANGRAASRSPVFPGLLLVLVLASHTAVAGGLSVSPTRAFLDAEQRVIALTVRNNTGRDVSFQLEPRLWTQAEGEDLYQATDELLGTPPIFTVAAGERQIVRLGLRRPPERDRELSYRLYIQELAPPTPEGFTGLQVVLRMGVPVFVAPAAGPATHDLHWSFGIDQDGQVALRVTNRGTGHAQVTQLKLAIGERSIEPGGMFYVLADAQRIRILPADTAVTPGTELELTARINGQPFATVLRVD